MNEIKQMKNVLKMCAVKDVEGAINVLNGYFTKVTFSLVKDEWENKMTTKQKQAFVKKLLKEIK